MCGKSFTRNRDMVSHKKKIHLMNERSTSETHKCRECHKVFESAHSLNIHHRVHSGTSMPAAPIAQIATVPIGK